MSTPFLEDVLVNAITSLISNINTAMPAKVLSYNASNQTATVQPMYKRKFSDNSEAALPVLNNVPVLFPRTKDAFLSLPIAAGDFVLLVFSQRSLDDFLARGEILSPTDSREYSINDAIAIPGLFPSSQTILASAQDVVLCNKDAKILLKEDGRFLIEGVSEELLSVLIDLIQAIIDMRINTMLGAQMPVNLATFMNIKSRLESLRG